MRKVGEAGRQSTMFGVLKKYGKGKIRLRKLRLKANDIYLVNFSWGFRPGSVDENNRRN